MWKVGSRIKREGVKGYVYDVKTSFSAYYHLENGTCGECLNELLTDNSGDTEMPKGRTSAAQKKAAAEGKQQNALLDAVKFCAGGYNPTGEAYSVHALIYNGWVTTYNGIVMYGHPIDTDMQSTPHYGLLLQALKATDGQAVQVTQLDAGRLQIKGKGFKTIVPCLKEVHLVSRYAPDGYETGGPLDSRMREGFEVMKQITNKRGETIAESAVLVRNGDMVATDRHMLGMFWHGIGFPELTIPADFIEAVLKTPKALVHFGFTPGQSVTFYFEDRSFIRTQLYAEAYPDVSKAIPSDWSNLMQLPDTFFDALDRIEPFVKSGPRFVYVNNNSFSTHDDSDNGTVVDCGGLVEAPSGMDVERIARLRDRITHIDYLGERITRFIGMDGNFRGVCSNAELERTEAAPQPPEQTLGEVAAQSYMQARSPEAFAASHVYAPPTPEVEDGEDVTEELPDPAPVVGGFGKPVL